LHRPCHGRQRPRIMAPLRMPALPRRTACGSPARSHLFPCGSGAGTRTAPIRLHRVPRRGRCNVTGSLSLCSKSTRAASCRCVWRPACHPFYQPAHSFELARLTPCASPCAARHLQTLLGSLVWHWHAFESPEVLLMSFAGAGPLRRPPRVHAARVPHAVQPPPGRMRGPGAQHAHQPRPSNGWAANKIGDI